MELVFSVYTHWHLRLEVWVTSSEREMAVTCNLSGVNDRLLPNVHTAVGGCKEYITTTFWWL